MDVKALEIPAVSFAGAAFGLTASEFISEFIARVSGQTEWMKFGVKAVTKIALSLIFYGVASKVSGMGSLAAELACYTTLGSIVLDFLMVLTAGGVTGMAEQAAVFVRGSVKGAEGITAELRRAEELAATGMESRT